MKLYSLAHSPFAARVRIQIYLKQLDVEIVPPPNFGTEEYKLINPTGKVPALQVDDTVIPESTVIMRYLEDSFPDVPLLTGDPSAKAIVNLFLRFTDVTIQPALFPIFAQVFARTDDEAALAVKFEALHDVLNMLNTLMQRYQWGKSQGGQFNADLADCALVPVFYYCVWLADLFKQVLRIDELKELNAWWLAAQKNHAIARVLAEMSDGLVAMQARLAKA